MKKILAGVLAAASMLTMTVSASAASNDKAIKAAGDITYDVAVTAPKIVLDLIMPAKISAQLNPYGAEIKLDNETTPTVTEAKIASVAYKVTNKSKDYGVWIDADATTTTSDAKTFEVKEVVAGKKTASLSLVADNTVAALKTIVDDISTAEYDTNAYDAGSVVVKQGALKLDSTVKADKTKGTAAGQTIQKKFMFVPANDGTNDGVAYMAFAGDLADVDWEEGDSINVALILKVSAGAKTIKDVQKGAGGGGGSNFTAEIASSVISAPATGWTLGALVANDTYALECDKDTASNWTPTFTGYTVTGATSDDTCVTARASDGRLTGNSDGTAIVTIDLEDSSDSSITKTVKFKVTVINS